MEVLRFILSSIAIDRSQSGTNAAVANVLKNTQKMTRRAHALISILRAGQFGGAREAWSVTSAIAHFLVTRSHFLPRVTLLVNQICHHSCLHLHQSATLF